MDKSSYTESHRRYYQKHRAEIQQKRKPVDRDYYERNKEAIRAKNLARYYAKKAAAATADASSAPPDAAPQDKFDSSPAASVGHTTTDIHAHA